MVKPSIAELEIIAARTKSELFLAGEVMIIATSRLNEADHDHRAALMDLDAAKIIASLTEQQRQALMGTSEQPLSRELHSIAPRQYEMARKFGLACQGHWNEIGAKVHEMLMAPSLESFR